MVSLATYRRWLSTTVCALGLLAPLAPVHAAEGDRSTERKRAEASSDGPYLEEERSRIDQHVQQLADHYREPWYEAAGEIGTGGLFLWLGTHRMIRHYRAGAPPTGRLDVPWFGLFATVSGAEAVATGIHMLTTPSASAEYARRLVKADLSREAGLLFLRHRAEVARQNRIRRGAVRIAASVGAAAYLFLLPTRTRQRRLENVLSASLGLATGAVTGLYWLLAPSFEERLYRRATGEGSAAARSPRVRPTAGLAPHIGPHAGENVSLDPTALTARVGLRVRW